MTTINTSNNVSTATYTVKTNNESQISSLQSQRESLQSEVQTLQESVSTGESSEETDSQIQILQSQIANIDSQIARLQSEQNEQSTNQGSNNKMTESVNTVKALEDPKTINDSLNKLDESARVLETSIALEKARGLNTESKDEVLATMKETIDKLSEKLTDKNERVENINSDVELVGNFVNSEA